MTVLLGPTGETSKVTRHWFTNGEPANATVTVGHEVPVVGDVVVVLEPSDLGMVAADQTFER